MKIAIVCEFTLCAAVKRFISVNSYNTVHKVIMFQEYLEKIR